MRSQDEAPPRKVVLIADDEAPLRQLYARVLAREGFEVVQAANGADALQRIEPLERVDAALLDWKMPVMDGAALCRALRAHPRFARTPIVIISGNIDAREAAATVGAQGALSKPAPLGAISAAIRSVLSATIPAIATS
ncbi:MAG: response regulator [Vicinamibacterales bacterium]